MMQPVWHLIQLLFLILVKIVDAESGGTITIKKTTGNATVETI